jgi:hypothetical protein
MAEQFQFSPEALAQIEAARLASANGGTYNALDSRYLPSQPGTLSPLDPLYGYAQTAPVLSLTGNEEYESLNFQALPDTSYRLVVGGKVVGTASTPEEVAQLVAQANQFSEAGGAKADVKVEKQLRHSLAGETERRFVPVYENNPNGTGLLGTLIPAALAAMSGGALAPFMGAGGMLGTGLYAGLGSIAGSLATGSPLGEALKKGAITGITAGGLSGLGAFGGSGVGDAAAGQVGSSLSPAFTNAISTPLVSGLTNVADDALISVLANTLGSGAGAGLSSAAGGVLGSVAGSGGGYKPQPDDPSMINVTGVRAPVPVSSGAPGLASGIGGVGAQAVADILAKQAAQKAAQEQADRQPEDTIVVTAPSKPFIPSWALPAAGVAGLAGLGSTLLGPGLTAPTTPSTPSVSADGVVESPEITVTASNTPVTPFVPPIITPTAALTTPRPITGDLAIPATALGGLTAAQALNQPGTPTQPRTLSDYINMVRGGIGVAGGIANLFGGGGDDGGALPPGFNANAGTVNYTPLARTQNVTPFDPFTYGQATGERSFFNPYELQYQTNVPTTPAATALAMKDGGEAEFDDSIEGHLAAYYSGGGHAGPGPVKGIGSGQEDKIPAWLSDGEYVWSAQDVADLGDGSTNEGVRRLDKMRQMVRKDAGRKDTKSIARPQKGIDSMLKAVGGAA